MFTARREKQASEEVLFNLTMYIYKTKKISTIFIMTSK